MRKLDFLYFRRGVALARYSEREHHRAVQSGVDLREWTGHDKYIHRLHANRNDTYRSSRYARVPIE